MPVPAGNFVLRDAMISIDGDEVAGGLSKARLVPDTPIQTMRTLVPDGIIQDVDSTAWTFELSGLQGAPASGIGAMLFAAAGTQITIVLQPRVGAGNTKATFDIIAMPVEFGGEQGAFNTFEAEFPVIGQPVFTTSVS
jgi:hypothetical protein